MSTVRLKAVKRWVPLEQVLRDVHAHAERRGVEVTLLEVRELSSLLFDEVKARVAQGERVSIPSFGIVEPTTRKARRLRNPRTRELMEIPATRSYRLKASRAL